MKNPHLNTLKLVGGNLDEVQVFQRDKPSPPPRCSARGVGAGHMEESWRSPKLCKSQVPP